MTTTKYFAYNPENEGALDGHTMYEEWADAAAEAMGEDLYAWECREITEADLPARFNVLDSDGRVVDHFSDREDADAEAASRSEGGEAHTVEQVADESDYNVGDFGLWVHGLRSWGNNRYTPEGVDHRDFTGITGSSVEDCLREYSERGDGGYCHPRHHIIVAEATFDDSGNLIEADGIEPGAENDE